MFLLGCSHNNTPIQAVIDDFQTDEVRDIVSTSYFIVRDTNQSIWLVTTTDQGPVDGTYYTFRVETKTLIFKGVKKLDKIKLEE